jgi:hypothetical protein
MRIRARRDLLLCIVGAITGCMPEPYSPPKPTSAPNSAAYAAPNVCNQQREARLAEIKQLMAAGEPWKAHLAANTCAAIGDAEFTALSIAAEVAEYRRAAVDKTLPARVRITMIERLEGIDPKHAAPFKALKSQLAQIDAAEDAAERRRIAAVKRREGVRLGMTQEDVLASSWGRPEHINRTISARGTREQWVYGGRNYLYFEDGILVTIQN